MAARRPADPALVGRGLLAAWLVHDLEELLTARAWGERVVPRLRRRHPGVPEAVWRALTVDTAGMAIAVGAVGCVVAAGAARGARTGGRSELFQTAVTAFGLHAVSHVGSAAVTRGYTPGVVTAVTVVAPYAVWARRRLRQHGVWSRPSPARLAAGAAATVALVGGAHALARLLRPGR